jgi:seryl-tRNA synthetase
MHDLKWIRENPSAFDRGRARRGLSPAAADLLALDARHRVHLTESQKAQEARNALSKQIGAAKANKDEVGATRLMNEVAAAKTKIEAEEAKAATLWQELERELSGIPNLPADDVPDGVDEHGNRQVRAWGEPVKFTFAAKEHFDLGEQLGLMSFTDGAKLSGARFTVLKGGLARLERAIGQFMIDIHTGEFGYTEVAPPLLVRDAPVYGTGSLPKFAEDLFRTENGYWLIPTAEVPLTNLAADSILEAAVLPWRFTALTPCFRSEAGAAGRDTRGMIRQHQFWKCELVSVTLPEESEAEHERMTRCAETILQRLGLPYRVMLLCAGDMGFASRRTYDIEVWLPGQGAYREISSCSNCGDFQARRMGARYRPAGEKQTRFLHTLNGSGLAVGRTLIAILENYQQADGSIAIPPALHPYMGGIERLGGN